jgi:hypothetical protein
MDIPRSFFRRPLIVFIAGGLLNPQPVVSEHPKAVKRNRKQDCAFVLAPFQRPVIPPAAKLHPDAARSVQSLVTREDYFGLGQLLSEMLNTPEGTWRVHVDKSLGTYLFEIVDKLMSKGLLLKEPTLEGYDRLLMAACIIARSKGRDFVVPDYIKLAVLALGIAEWHLSEDGIISIMDKVAVPAV